MLNKILIILIVYFCFGLYSPVRVSYINTISISYLNAALYFASSYFIEAILFIRNYLV